MDEQSQPAGGEAIFNIGAVTRMTGVPIATLHAWERRYGFPGSLARTLGGHRLYTEKDVTLLRNIKAQIDQGVSARQAVAAVQKMDAEGRLPVEHPLEAHRTLPQIPVSPAGHTQLAEALFQHDLRLADRLMADMLAFTAPEEIILNVVGPLLAEIGQAWADGRITVTDEHLASNYLRQHMLMWMVNGPCARTTGPVVLACGPGEWHEGSLLMLGVLLRRQGWPVAYLGQNVPFADLSDFAGQVRASALVLVAMCAEQAQTLADWPDWIKQVDGRPLVTYGGRSFVLQPELKERMSGIYLGDTIQQGVVNLEELLR